MYELFDPGIHVKITLVFVLLSHPIRRLIFENFLSSILYKLPRAGLYRSLIQLNVAFIWVYSACVHKAYPFINIQSCLILARAK